MAIALAGSYPDIFAPIDKNVRSGTLYFVGVVTAIALAGLDLWFNSDDHLPAHFHAEKAGKWEVRVFFLRDCGEMFETKWTARTGRPNRSELKELARLAEENRAALLAEWQRKVNVKTRGGTL